VVPEVRVRHRPLVAEGHRARLGLRPLQSWLLQPFPRQRPHGLQRHGQVHHQVRQATGLRSVRSGNPEPTIKKQASYVEVQWALLYVHRLM